MHGTYNAKMLNFMCHLVLSFKKNYSKNWLFFRLWIATQGTEPATLGPLDRDVLENRVWMHPNGPNRVPVIIFCLPDDGKNQATEK